MAWGWHVCYVQTAGQAIQCRNILGSDSAGFSTRLNNRVNESSGEGAIFGLRSSHFLAGELSNTHQTHCAKRNSWNMINLKMMCDVMCMVCMQMPSPSLIAGGWYRFIKRVFGTSLVVDYHMSSLLPIVRGAASDLLRTYLYG